MCPNCGRVGTIEQKTLGMSGKDMNHARCGKCPWEGLAYQCEVKHVVITVGEIEEIMDLIEDLPEDENATVLTQAHSKLKEVLI